MMRGQLRRLHGGASDNGKQQRGDVDGRITQMDNRTSTEVVNAMFVKNGERGHLAESPG